MSACMFKWQVIDDVCCGIQQFYVWLLYDEWCIHVLFSTYWSKKRTLSNENALHFNETALFHFFFQFLMPLFVLGAPCLFIRLIIFIDGTSGRHNFIIIRNDIRFDWLFCWFEQFANFTIIQSTPWTGMKILHREMTNRWSFKSQSFETIFFKSCTNIGRSGSSYFKTKPAISCIDFLKFDLYEFLGLSSHKIRDAYNFVQWLQWSVHLNAIGFCNVL